ncbi:SubName: Full=Uncharacterized protein {ECO:0000313/EMBL:CCA67639.1} [Serendipita indica DSM 11827]|uniref:Chromatin modification-related protein EAF6 n=1 Tax=Serendipita indica (strain DSM 11827) TaxID=1109443 RepID=G4T8J1_SERID|nr:SubName: Full=Uncharacterized protein {ECO:0000313/EMBL:CCA67639.1} [Serendipita indica DSM 11827]CCA67639.1 hypothetical protein PIIN_01468 [Serendipita indica DSM 11827]
MASASSTTTTSANTATKKATTASGSTAPAANSEATTSAVAATTGVDLSDPKTSYENAKKDLIQAIQRRKQLDKQLVQVETQIFNAEGQYIAETAGTGGNIIHGFENYLKSASTNRKRVDVAEIDRVFSQSSITYRKSLDMAEDSSSLEDGIAATHVTNAAGITTVTLTPATRTQEAQTKRDRDRAYQRKKRASMRQSTISDEEMPKKRRKFVED